MAQVSHQGLQVCGEGSCLAYTWPPSWHVQCAYPASHSVAVGAPYSNQTVIYTLKTAPFTQHAHLSMAMEGAISTRTAANTINLITAILVP